MTSKFHRQCFGLMALVCLCLGAAGLRAATVDELRLLENRCLYFAVGHAPKDVKTVTIRHGLYAQSPFSAAGEVDLAASGFALAALPVAVENGLIQSNAAFGIALSAASTVKQMVAKSAGAKSPEEIERYGYRGMLPHYFTWNETAGEFHGNRGVEVSSVDTAILMFGLLTCANYFERQVRMDFETARDGVRWRDWLDTESAGHKDQFHMAYSATRGWSSWWGNYTQETMLVCLCAAMSDRSLDARRLWHAWKRTEVTYVPPGDAAPKFQCYASYFGDPFTVFYGQTFIDFKRLGRDADGVDWFAQAQMAYRGSVEYFARERGYRDGLTLAFVSGAQGALAKPKLDPAEPKRREDAAIYSVAGGLVYFEADPEKNSLAKSLAQMVRATPKFFAWHGWPASTVNAVEAGHPVMSEKIVGQDVCAIALSIDNYLNGRVHAWAMRDARLKEVLGEIYR